MTTPPAGQDTRKDPPLGAPRRFPAVSAIFLAAVVVIGVIALIITRAGGGIETAQPTVAEPAPTASSAPVPGNGPISGTGPCGATSGAFGVPSSDRTGRRLEVPVDPAGQVCPATGPTAAAAGAASQNRAATPLPAGLVWQKIYGAALPFSTSDGPSRIVDGVPSGFGHTPQGAVIAALQIIIRQGFAQDHATRVRVTDSGFVMSEAIKPATLATMGGLPLATSAAAAGYCIESGVRTTTYADDFAHVEWALPVPSGGYVTDGFDVVWSDGDWKISTPNGIEAELARPGHAVPISVLDASWSSWN